MKAAPIPSNEADRLRSLNDLNLLDTLPEDVYEDIISIASEICSTPIALLSLVDEKRQWFKSKKGLDASETPRELSFCAHAIMTPDEPFVVPDARYDERFHDNPLTTGEPHVVFYAGVPVKDEAGHALGTICVIDNRPRELTDEALHSLKALAKLVNTHFVLRKAKQGLESNRSIIQAVHPLADQILSEVESLKKNTSPDLDKHLINVQAAVQVFKV